jgi:hypothetical protein
MVDGQQNIGHRPDSDRIDAIHLTHHLARLGLADAEDSRLRLVDCQ